MSSVATKPSPGSGPGAKSDGGRLYCLLAEFDTPAAIMEAATAVPGGS